MIFKSHIDTEDVKIKLDSIEELPDSKIALLSEIFSNETLLSMDKNHFRKAIKVLIRKSFFFTKFFSKSFFFTKFFRVWRFRMTTKKRWRKFRKKSKN